MILVGGMTRMPAVVEAVKAIFGQGAAQGRQPGRGRRGRRGDPGGRARRRGQGRPPPRRHAALARHRDPGRRHDPAHRPEHDDPDLEERRSFSTASDNQNRSRSTCSRASATWRPTTRHSAGSSSTGSRRRRGACRRSRSPSIIDANGILDVSAKDRATAQGAAGPDHGLFDARQGRRRPDGPRGPGARRGGPHAARGRRDPQPGRAAHLPGGADDQGSRRESLGRGPRGRRGGDREPPQRAQDRGHRRRPAPG